MNLQFKGKIMYSSGILNFNGGFQKKEVILKGLDEYHGNELLLTVLEDNFSVKLREMDVVTVDYIQKVNQSTTNQKYYGSAVLITLDENLGPEEDMHTDDDDIPF